MFILNDPYEGGTHLPDFYIVKPVWLEGGLIGWAATIGHQLDVGGMTAVGLLEALSPNFAQAQQVSPADTRLVGATLGFDSPQGSGKASGYLVKPAKADTSHELGERRPAQPPLQLPPAPSTFASSTLHENVPTAS